MDKQYFLDKLTKTRPSVFEAYSYDLLPLEFKAHDKIAIECYEHGVFYQKAGAHLFSAGCPECGRRKVEKSHTLTTDDFICKSKSKFGNKFSYSKTNYVKKGVDLTITCPSHGDITTKPEWHMWSKHGCPKCDFEIPRLIKKQKIIEKALKIHGDKYDYSKVDFVNVNKKVEIICKKHGSFWQGLYLHLNAPVGCPSCSREADKLSQDDFISKAKAVHGDTYDYGKVNFEAVALPVTITCKKHGDFKQRAQSHLLGNGCKECFLERNRGTTEQFIKDAKRIHGNNYDYSKVKYTGSKVPVEIICPTHGSFWQKPNRHTSSRNGCRFCSESKGEREIELILKKYGIDYIREYRILPYLYRYDFYLPGLDIYIEFNGIQHYFPVETFGGLSAHLKTKENDLIKAQLVKSRKAYLAIVTFRSQNKNSVEKDLIRELKRFYRYWFVVNGQLRIFRRSTDVCREFGIPGTVELKNLVTEVSKAVKDFSVLF